MVSRITRCPTCLGLGRVPFAKVCSTCNGNGTVDAGTPGASGSVLVYALATKMNMPTTPETVVRRF